MDNLSQKILPAGGYQQANTTDLAHLIMGSLDNDKAEDITRIDLRGKSAFADDMIVASGRSGRHVNAIAEHLLRLLKSYGLKNVQVEGMANCDWVLVDAGDVVVHIFRPEVRQFYAIEKMWLADLSEPPERP